MAANTCNQPPSFHNGTGAQADYTIGFPYINRADVEVYVGSADDWTQYTEGNAANANEYQWQNDTTIRLNAASGTDNVRITRETDRCDAQATFNAGTAIRSEDLNDNQTQALYITQEIIASLGDLGITVPPGSSGDVDTSTWNDPSYLKWTGEGFTANGVLEAGDAWQDSDDWIVTAAAGDDRWLTIPGGGGSPITAGDGIRIDAPAEINVDLDTNSGLEFNSGDLRVNPGQGIVVDGGEVLVRGNQRRIGTVQFGTGDIYTFPTSDGTANQVLTTNGSGTLRWETPTGGGGGGAGATVANTTALNAVAVPADREPGNTFMVIDSTNIDGTGADTAPNNDPNPAITGLPAAPSGGWGAAINVIVAWNTADDGWTFVGYRSATPDERYVLETGDTMSGNLLFNDGTANTAINADGSAVFNENGDAVDFRVESDANVNMLVVDGSANRVGIGEATPLATLDVNGAVTVDGDITIEDGAGLILQNDAEDQTVTINADDATATYTVTLPPTAPTANGQVLSVASGTTDAELEWSTPSAGINGIRVEDDGTSIVATATALNFTGAGVTVTDSGSGEAQVAIAGGGGGSALIAAQNPTIAAAVVGQAVAVDETADELIQAGGVTPYSFQSHQWSWQAEGETGFENITGATNATFTVPEQLSYGGTNVNTVNGQLRVQVVIQDSSSPVETVTLTSPAETIDDFSFNMSWAEGIACLRRYDANGATTNTEFLFGPAGSNGRVINMGWRCTGVGFSGQNLGVLADGTLYQGNSTGATLNTTRNTDFDRNGRQIRYIFGITAADGCCAIYDDGSAQTIRTAGSTVFDSNHANWVAGGIVSVNSSDSYFSYYQAGRLANGQWVALTQQNYGGTEYQPFDIIDFPDLPGGATIVDWTCIFYNAPNSTSSPIAWLGSDGVIYATGSYAFSNGEWNGTNGWDTVANFSGQSADTGRDVTFQRVFGYLTNSSGVTLMGLTMDGELYWGTGNSAATAFRDKGFTNVRRLPFGYSYAYAQGAYNNWWGVPAGDDDIIWFNTITASSGNSTDTGTVFTHQNGGANWGAFGPGNNRVYAQSGLIGNLFIVPQP